MPKRISQLDAAGPLTGAELVPLVQNSRTKYATMDTLSVYGDTSCQCTLVSRYNTVSTSADTTETFAQSYTLPANTLNTDGSWLEIMAWGSFAANNNNKTITLYFGSTTFSQTYSTTNGNAGRWIINARLIRSSSSTQAGFVEILANKDITPNSSSGNTTIVAGSENMASDVVISVSITNGTASAADIVSNGLLIRLNKVDADS